MAVTINGTTGISTTGDYDAEDGDKILLGTDDDLQIFHNGSNSLIENTNGNIIIKDTTGSIYLQSSGIYIQDDTTNEEIAHFISDGAVELYHNNVKTFETTQYGATCKLADTSAPTLFMVVGSEGQDAEIRLLADDGDDGPDYWRLLADASSPDFYLQNYHSGAWETNIKGTGSGSVELYYNNVKKLHTTLDGAQVDDHLGVNISTSGWGDSMSVGTYNADGYAIAIRHEHDNAGLLMRFTTTDGVCGTVTASGTSTTYNTSSDYRLKENQVAISDGITRLKTLKPYRFNWIADSTNTLEDGFFAHEVAPAVPEAITGEKDTPIDEQGMGYQQIDQSKLVPLLTAALQEAITKIETLETKVAALEAA